MPFLRRATRPKRRRPIATYAANGKGDVAGPRGAEQVSGRDDDRADLSNVPAAGAGCRRRLVPGFGRHEVIIESPRHVASLSELTDAEAELVFRPIAIGFAS